MKLIGAVLVIFACASVGLTRISYAKARIDLLASLSQALSLMKSELNFNLTPLPRLAVYMTAQSRGAVERFFSSLSAELDALGEREFSLLWAASADSELSALKKDELEEFKALGRVLGRAELSVQLSALERCMTSFEAVLADARAEYPQQRRLAIGLSAASGLMLVIMFL